MSDTSSNLSYVTSSGFKPKNSQLDVIREHTTFKEEDEENEDSEVNEGSDEGKHIGQRAKRGSNQ